MTTKPRNLLSTTGLGLALIGALALWPASRVSAQDLPFTVEWIAAPDLQVSTHLQEFCTYGVLADGRGLFMSKAPGDWMPRRILLFDPEANTWTWKATLPRGSDNRHQRLYPLADGRVLVMNGSTYPPYAEPWEVYIYDPATDTFERKADLLPHNFFLADGFSELATGEIFVFGGGPPQGMDWDDGFIYDRSANTWRNGGGIKGSFTYTILGTRLPGGGYSCIKGNSVLVFDPGTMAWRDVSIPAQFSSGTLLPALAEGRVYFGQANTCNLLAYDLVTDAFSEIGVGSAPGTHQSKRAIHTSSAGGRDWLFHFFTPDWGQPDYGIYNTQVRDPDSGTWVDLARGPVRIHDPSVTYDSYNNFFHMQLTNGVLLGGVVSQTGVVKTQRLRVIPSGGPVAPYVATVVPASVSMDEGDTASIEYKLLGDIPTAGVEVIVERSQGDGDVRLLKGLRQRIMSRSDVGTAQFVALIDADNVDDQAVIQVRVVQAGGGADPKARTIPVTVRDLYHDGNQPPAIVSPAWADPNPAPLATGTTLHVVAADPDGDPLTYAWTKVSGPGTATFATPTAADTGATFGAPGTYVLRVSISDGRGGNVTSDITVAVTDGSGVDPRADVNHDGVVNALDLQIVIANFGKVVP